MIKILIADSFYLSRSGLTAILSNQPDFEVVCQTFDSNRLQMDILGSKPDLVVLDIRLQPDCPTGVVQDLTENGKSKFLVLANEANDPQIISLLHAGAQGCVQKDAGEETLLQAIRDVAADKSPISSNVACELLKYLRNQKDPGNAENADEVMLSHRELMVLRLMAEGLPNKVIGAQLDISERTVEAHVRNILKKLNASNRTQAAFLASKYGWLVTPN